MPYTKQRPLSGFRVPENRGHRECMVYRGLIMVSAAIGAGDQGHFVEFNIENGSA